MLTAKKTNSLPDAIDDARTVKQSRSGRFSFYYCMRAYIRKILALVIRNAFLTATVNGGRGSGRLDMVLAAVSDALVGVEKVVVKTAPSNNELK